MKSCPSSCKAWAVTPDLMTQGEFCLPHSEILKVNIIVSHRKDPGLGNGVKALASWTGHNSQPSRNPVLNFTSFCGSPHGNSFAFHKTRMQLFNIIEIAQLCLLQMKKLKAMEGAAKLPDPAKGGSQFGGSRYQL